MSGHCSLGKPRTSWPVRGRFALHNTVPTPPPQPPETETQQEAEEVEEEAIPTPVAVQEEVKPKQSHDEESDTLSFFANLAEND